MSRPQTSIIDLSQAILLDDVTDVFYRSLVYPFFNRCHGEPTTALESKLDAKLEQRLARKLNWTAALTSLDTVTHRFSHFVEELEQGLLTAKKLDDMLEQNYWLQAAFIDAKQTMGLATDTDFFVLENAKKRQLGQVVNAICWKYFELQMSEPAKQISKHMASLSDAFVNKAVEVAHERDEQVSTEQLFDLAFFNFYPMLVLLRLFDKAVQSIKQEELNALPESDEQNRLATLSYQPSADILLSFLKFDEFIKPHVLDSLNLDASIQTNLIQGKLGVEPKAELFLQGRTRVINERMAEFQVLTPAQMLDCKEQLGIRYEINRPSNLNEKYAVTLSKLLDIQPKVA